MSIEGPWVNQVEATNIAQQTTRSVLNDAEEKENIENTDKMLVLDRETQSLKFVPAADVLDKANQAIAGLAAKVDKTTTVAGKPLTGNITIDKTDVGLSNVSNLAPADLPVSTAQQTAINQIASGVKIVSPTSAPLANVDSYKPDRAGTYTLFGSIVVSSADLEAGDVFMNRDVDGIWSKKIIPVAGLAAYKLKADDRDKGIFDSIALALEGVPLVSRKLGDTVGVKENGSVVEYWWGNGLGDGDLVLKQPDIRGLTEDVNTSSAILDLNFSKTSIRVSKYKSIIGTTYLVWFNTGSTFSGSGSAIGAPNTSFNSVDFKIRTRAVAITKIYVRVTKDTKDGELVASKNIEGLNLSPSTIHNINVDFGEEINVTGRLYFSYATDQLSDAYGVLGANIYPYPEYPLASWNAAGEMNFPLSGDYAPSVGFNTTLLVELYNNVVSTEPKPYLTDGIITKLEEDYPLSTLSKTTELVEKTSELIDIFTGQEIYDKSKAKYSFLTSVFSGWITPIGTPLTVKDIQFRIRARSAAISSIYWEVRDVTATAFPGTLLKSGTIIVNIAPNTSSDVVAEIPEMLNNSNGNKLLFGYKSNALCDAFGIDTNVIFPSPEWPPAAYAINGVQTANNWGAVTSGQFNSWLSIGTLNKVATPTDGFMNQIQERVIIPPSSNVLIPKAEIILDSRIYALESKETNIYFDNIISSNMPLSVLDIDVNCAKGFQNEKFYRVNPVSGDAGSHALTITVSHQGVILASYAGSINIASASSGSGVTRNVNFWGDSTLVAGQPQTVIINEDSADVMKIAFKGTQGSALNKHEGRSGWAIKNYATFGVTFYKFQLSGVTTSPGLNAVYTNNGSSFTVRELNITGGVGYISTERTTGTNNPTASGNLVKSSGNGDATLSFSETSIVTGNPLWNAATSQVDYANYLTANSITMNANDIFAIHLGINDVFGQTDDAALAVLINTMVQQLRTIVSSVHSAVPGIKVAIMVTIMPSASQDAFGANYSTNQYRKRYLKNITTYQKRLISEFDNNTERTAGNYLVPFNAVVDTDNNFPTSMVAANARNAATIKTWTNGVHPSQSGYDQMGDQLKAFIKFLQSLIV